VSTVETKAKTLTHVGKASMIDPGTVTVTAAVTVDIRRKLLRAAFSAQNMLSVTLTVDTR